MSGIALDYRFLPSPNPIRASADGAPRTVDLELMISYPGTASITLARIALKIPVGQSGAGYLSASPNLPSPQPASLGGWSASGAGSWLTLTPAGGAPTATIAAGAPLLLVLRQITVDAVPGTVHVEAVETPPSGGPVGAPNVTSIVKWPDDFVVADFSAVPATLTDIEKSVTLQWRVTQAEREHSTCVYALHSELWQGRDCLGAGDCYTWQDGEAGVSSPPLNDPTEFTLDVISTNPQGGRQLVASIDTRVLVEVPAINENSYCDSSPTGRLASLHWLATNAGRCAVSLDGTVIDAHAPLDTYESGYCVVLPAGELHQLAVTGYAAMGKALSQHPFPDIGPSPPVNVPIPHPPWSVAITPDSALVLVGTEVGLQVVDLASNQAEPTMIDVGGIGNALYVALSPDGRLAITVGAGQVTIIDVAARRALHVVSVDNAVGVAVAPDGARAVVSVNHQQDLLLVDLPSGELEPDQIPLSTDASPIAYTPDGALLLATDARSNSVLIVDIATRRQIATIPVGSYPADLAITPDGTHALVVNAIDTTVSVIDIATRTAERATISIPGEDLVSNIGLTSDGRWALITSYDSGNVTAIDVPARKVVPGKIAVGGNPTSLAIAPSGAVAALAALTYQAVVLI